MDKIINTIAEELNIKPNQVESTVKLIDEGNTIPFIARYRKEVTGGLSDEILRDLGERLTYLRNLEKRKEEIIKSIDEQGKLTDEILQAVAIAKILSEVEDIYRPYKQKKKTRATVAKAKGLEPLAKIIIEQKEVKPIEEVAKEYVNIDKLSDEDKKNKDKVVATVEDAIQGALDIIAEDISDNAKYRKEIKRICYREGQVVTRASKPEEKSNYEMYYEYQEAIKFIPSHRILAINRGEKEEFLKIKLEKPEEKILKYIEKDIIKNTTQFTEMLKTTIEDSFKRLIEPSVDREIRSDLTEKAEEKAIKVFGKNSKQLLLGAPIKNKIVMGFDPAYRTGCKIAVIDETGKLLEYTTAILLNLLVPGIRLSKLSEPFILLFGLNSDFIFNERNKFFSVNLLLSISAQASICFSFIPRAFAIWLIFSISNSFNETCLSSFFINGLKSTF